MSFRIDMKSLTKQFGETTALWRVSARFEEGDRVCLLGHNGAGKSTLLNLAATLSRPTGGELHYALDGQVLTQKNDIRRQIAYLSHEPMLYPDLTALENLRFVCRMTGRPGDDATLTAVLDEVGMGRHGDTLFRNCSRGMRQRLALARVLIMQPRLWLLDEPFSGLDFEGVARLKRVFAERADSWIMVTHHLHLGYDLANRFWVLERGRLRHDLAKADLSRDAFWRLVHPGGEGGAP